MVGKPYVMGSKVLYDVKRPILGPEKAIWFLSNYSYFKIAILVVQYEKVWNSWIT